MEQFEKAVKGLSCHVYGHPHTRCHNCPYWGTGPHGSSECSVLAADALALIRQQQTRIVGLEKAIAKWEKYTGFLAAHGVLKEGKPDE